MDQMMKIVNRPTLAILHTAKALTSIPDHHTYNPVTKADEVQILGISLGGMAAEYGDVIAKTGAVAYGQLGPSGLMVMKVLDVKERKDKNKNLMAFTTLLDVHGAKIEGAIMFASCYSKMNPKPKKGEIYGMAVQRLTNGIQVTAIQHVDSIRGKT